jgi:osmotically inducible lipoprotein OsmB
MTARLGIALVVAALLVGCGATQEDRAISVGAIGAGAGGLAGALTGNPAAGALASQDRIDLGRPVWR